MGLWGRWSTLRNKRPTPSPPPSLGHSQDLAGWAPDGKTWVCSVTPELEPLAGTLPGRKVVAAKAWPAA